MPLLPHPVRPGVVTLLLAACLVTGWGCGSSTGAGPDAAVDGAPPDGHVATDAGADGSAPDCTEHVFEDITVPLTDGKSLAGFVRRPVNNACRLPTILIQTPYNKDNARTLWFESSEPNPLFESRDYAFVVVDWRGFYGSAAAATAQPDYGADGYDTVEWIAAQPWSDGQVATWGVSALGRVQYWTATKAPPHLVAAVPIFGALNTTYPEYYPGGVLRREYVDTLGVLFGQSVVEDHPLEDAAWSWIGALYSPADIAVPMLVVAGWYDLDDERSFRDFAALTTGSDSAVRAAHRLLVGPWSHQAAGGESTGSGRPLTAQELRYYDADKRIQTDSLAWFDHWLRGRDAGVSGWAAVRFRADGEDTWSDTDVWPPADVESRELYLQADGTLADAADTGGSLSFDFDPLDPSPTIGGQTLRPDLLHGPQDQADVIARGDVLVFIGAPLTAALRLRGPLELDLAVTTTGADTDFVARLVDVADDGTSLLLTDGVRRLSLRDGYGAKSAVTPGERTELTVPFTNQLGYTFAAGHRVGVIVSASDWPRFARNPGTGDDFFDQATSPVAVTNTVVCDSASRLVLTVEP